MKEVWKKRKMNPEEFELHRKKISETTKQAMQRPEIKLKQLEGTRLHPSPGRLKIKETMKKWRKEHPKEYAESEKRRIESTRAFRIKWNKENPQHYWLGKKRPPHVGKAISESKKGKTWEEILGTEGAKQKHEQMQANWNNPEKDQEKTEHYQKYGWKVINLYPEDLKDEQKLIKKIQGD